MKLSIRNRLSGGPVYSACGAMAGVSKVLRTSPSEPLLSHLCGGRRVQGLMS